MARTRPSGRRAVTDLWVCNASPVIVLAKTGQLSLVDALCRQLLLPDAVAEDILRGPEDDPARAAVLAGWGKRVSPAGLPRALVEWGLGIGETSVLAVALEHMPCGALLDDAVARAACRSFGVPTMGTLGLLLKAKVLGLVASGADAIGEVRKAGLYLDDSTVDAALRGIGETDEATNGRGKR